MSGPGKAPGFVQDAREGVKAPSAPDAFAQASVGLTKALEALLTQAWKESGRTELGAVLYALETFAKRENEETPGIVRAAALVKLRMDELEGE